MNGKRIVLKRRVILTALVLIVITSLLISGSGLPVSAQGNTQKADPNPPGLLVQCSKDLSGVSYNAQTGKIRFIGTEAGKSIPQPDGIQSFTPEEAARAYRSEERRVGKEC